MTAAGALLREEIERTGPIGFHRFMEVALYHPEHGYYLRKRDPFGKEGDFYTAEQVQPTFGILMRSVVRSLLAKTRESDGGSGAEPLSVVEPGAGRAEMAEYFGEFRYLPVEREDEFPKRIRGVVFANEFFDALPVRVAVRRGDEFHKMSVGCEGNRFRWVEGKAVSEEEAAYLKEHATAAPDGAIVEAPLDALRWVERISTALDAGYLLMIDYGYTARELVRFPHGTLMSYRSHRASEDVLSDPGEQDITAHVPFSALEKQAILCGMRLERFETLAAMLLSAGEENEFQEVLSGTDDREELRRRLQLKQLLFGMGETFRVLLLRKQNTPA